MLRTAVARLRGVSGPLPSPSRRDLRIDAALALGLALAAVYTVHTTGVTTDFDPKIVVFPTPGKLKAAEQASDPGLRDFLSAVLTTLPLALRRRFPLGVFWLVIGMTILSLGRGDATTTLLACALAAYTVAAHGPYRPATLVSLLGAAVAVAVVYGHAIPNIPKALGVFLVIVPIAAAGVSIRTMRIRVAEAQERTRVLERDKERTTQLATEQERARIARELHDVITHNVSVMVVQAGAARKIMAKAPDQATSALLVVESAGRAAMTELQHTIGLLAPDGETQLAPQPGLAELSELIDRVRATGMSVELVESGTPRELTPGSDLAAYRVVQEALTNVVKHAVGAAAHVRITYARHDLVVEVENGAGARAASAAEGNGRGLMGLRERLSACDGELEAGPRRGGGFRIRAAIPLAERDAGQGLGGLGSLGGLGGPAGPDTHETMETV